MLKIIIIDDDPAKVKIIKSVIGEIQEINCKFVDTACSVEEAESKMEKNQFDLAILDLYLPLRHGDDPNPDNAISLIKDLSSEDDISMPYNIVGITQWKDADPKYKDFFDNLLLAYILYDRFSDDWKFKLKNKIEFLIKAQKSVQEQSHYDYDVAIVNALESENQKVRECFGPDGWKQEIFPADPSTTYFTKTVYSDKDEPIRIVTCYALQMACTASTALTTKLIFNYRPKYLFMTGIAAAVERSEVNLGDIMIASKVWDGASGKIKTSDDGNDIFSPDYHELTLDTDMLGIANRIKVNRALLNQIEESYTYTRGKPGNKLNVHIGPIASVPAVLASRDEVEKIKIHCRKLLGIEMEGYGVFYAANNSAHPRPKYTVLLKSVSDYSDSEKSDNYQDYAMYTSASLAKHIVTSQLEYD